MIIGSLTQTKRFEILHPDFKKVFEYVRSGNWQQVTAGKIILEEDKIWVNVDEEKQPKKNFGFSGKGGIAILFCLFL